MLQIYYVVTFCVAFSVASTTIKPNDNTNIDTKKSTEAYRRNLASRRVFIQEENSKAEGGFRNVFSGTVLTPSWILTTAHNLDDVNGKKLRVLYEGTGKVTTIKNQFTHPDWVKGTKTLPAENNIALLELGEKLTFPSNVSSFYLQPLDKVEEKELSKHVRNISFYKDKASTPPEKLNSFSESPCKDHPLNTTLVADKVCEYVCTNITGSPLWVQKNPNVAVLFGIVQVDVLPCGDKGPYKFFTKIDAYQNNFIKSHIKNETLNIFPTEPVTKV